MSRLKSSAKKTPMGRVHGHAEDEAKKAAKKIKKTKPYQQFEKNKDKIESSGAFKGLQQGKDEITKRTLLN